MNELVEKLRKDFLDSWWPQEVGKPYEQLFAELIQRYSEPHRHYHNLQHIDECLVEYARIKDELLDIDERLKMAIWFHDAVYDTRAHDNEEQSARLARSLLLRLGIAKQEPEHLDNLSLDYITEVEKCILATRHTERPIGFSQEYIVDIDLSILGKPEKRFDEYDAAIRQEYLWVPDEQYREGRSRIFHSFLERSRIFYTDHFADKYEIKARENLERAIERLE
ncbi:MAG: N-methyl-D-aspartate receptor NMDAR2C subunit [Nanoarchaeota archaeon]|nr:N-methyl-D-aspartate receptor NMDAR2C subunit [Nanoarchaeota archaeon]